jgi:hypothetical protein
MRSPAVPEGPSRILAEFGILDANTIHHLAEASPRVENISKS